MNATTADTPETWVRPETDFHAHFDCFSGAAGDMMLASCLDAAGDRKTSLLQHVTRSLEEGMPELRGEFGISVKQVWRGMGSIAAMHVSVQSKYGHKAAPVPTRSDKSITHSHSHSHKDSTTIGTLDQESSHSHGHNHVSPTSDDAPSSHSHSHSHGATGDALPQSSHSHHHDHDHGDYDSNEHASHDHHHEHGHNHAHSHGHQSSTAGPLRNLPQIRKLLQDASEDYISPWVKKRAIAAFTALAEAEARTHAAASRDAVHFHEVGAVDSIVDTVGTLIALDALGVTYISCSRLPLGEGSVWTDHGLLPVPAPAALRLMIDMPTCPGPKGVTGELVTPTAAALLKVCVSFGPNNSPIDGRPPPFTLRKVGIGAGTKDFEKHPNIVRLLLGDAVAGTAASGLHDSE